MRQNLCRQYPLIQIWQIFCKLQKDIVNCFDIMLNNQQMGCLNSHLSDRVNNQALTVASLNYSGTIYSPFEYYSSDKRQMALLEQIGRNLQQQLRTATQAKGKSYNRKEFSWKMSKIDKIFKVGRYSCLYDKSVGTKNGKIVSQKQFSEQWHKVYKQYTSKKPQQFKGFKQDEIQQLLFFDLICFKAIIQYLYKNKLDLVGGKQSSAIYQKFQNQQFQKNYLNLENKETVTMKNIYSSEKLDVIGMQQITPSFRAKLQSCKNYVSFFNNQSSISFHKSKFAKIIGPQEIAKQLQKQFPKLKEEFNFASDSVFGMADNILFFSVHLSSDKVKNAEQVSNMILKIKQIREKNNFQIVALGDFNSYIRPQLVAGLGFHVYPSNQNIPTTLKKRTFLQTQTKKSDTIAMAVRDQIMSTFQIKNSKISLVDQKWPAPEKDSFLPTDIHPYDHYLILSQVLLKKQKGMKGK